VALILAIRLKAIMVQIASLRGGNIAPSFIALSASLLPGIFK